MILGYVLIKKERKQCAGVPLSLIMTAILKFLNYKLINQLLENRNNQ